MVTGMKEEGRTGIRERVRAVFSRENQFRGADIVLARRFTRIGWLLGAAVVYALLPFYPPDKVIGDAGWLVAPGALAPAVLCWFYFLFKHEERVKFNALLATSYMGVAMVAIHQWLAGGIPAPYHELYPFMICAAASVHPPRRFIPFVVVTWVVVIVPELGRPLPEVGDLVAELVLFLGASLFVLALMWKLRQQRADLREGEARARELARVDSLTGLGNRRAFDEALTSELSRNERAHTPLSLLVCDLDNFKQINDAYGHLSGDDCLRQVAETLRAELRQVDSAFRWGGDEFVLVLTDTDADGAAEIGRRLADVIHHACSRPDGTPLAVTTGHAELHQGMTGQELLAAADLSLRERKQVRSRPEPRGSYFS
jgi:diguanylate cyclase (GGDEF)-like protein